MRAWNPEPARRALRELAANHRAENEARTLTPEGHRWVAQRLADGLFRPPTDVIAYFGLDPETDWMEEL